MVQKAVFTIMLTVFSGIFIFDSSNLSSQTNIQTAVPVIDTMTGTPIPKIALGDSAIMTAIDNVHRSFLKTDSLTSILNGQEDARVDSIFNQLVKEMDENDRRASRRKRK